MQLPSNHEVILKAKLRPDIAADIIRINEIGESEDENEVDENEFYGLVRNVGIEFGISSISDRHVQDEFLELLYSDEINDALLGNNFVGTTSSTEKDRDRNIVVAINNRQATYRISNLDKTFIKNSLLKISTWDKRIERTKKGEYDNFWFAFFVFWMAIVLVFGFLSALLRLIFQVPMVSVGPVAMLVTLILAIWRFYYLRKTNQQDI